MLAPCAPQKYGYSIPDNAYLWGALKRLQQLNAAVWRDARIAAATQQLMADIHSGIQQYGIVRVAQGVEVYAYEVRRAGLARCCVLHCQCALLCCAVLLSLRMRKRMRCALLCRAA